MLGLAGYTKDEAVMRVLRELQKHGFTDCTVGDLLAQPEACARRAEMTQMRLAFDKQITAKPA